MSATHAVANGHRWPCTRFYALSSEGDRCTCRAVTALPLEPHTEAEEATLARFEGAEPAEESFANVERIMQAIWEAADGYMSGVPWERAKANPFKEAKVFRQAIAAIAAIAAPVAQASGMEAGR